MKIKYEKKQGGGGDINEIMKKKRRKQKNININEMASKGKMINEIETMS